MENALTTAQLAWRDMVRLAGNCDFAPSLENTNAQLVRKTIVARAVKETVEHAVEVVGGPGFYCQLPFERMWRDVQAAHYHPLPEKKQHVFTGRSRLGVEAPWDV